MKSLPLFHRVTGRPVIVMGDGAAAEAKRHLVERAGGLVVTNLEAGVARGARLAFVALDDLQAAQDTAEKLRQAGLLVNVVDRPDLCDFTTPSVLDRDPVLLAIGTNGASAGLAKHLRLRLEALLPAGLGKLAEGLASAREAIRHRWPDAMQRRQALDAALGEGGPLDPLSGSGPAEIIQWLTEKSGATTGRRIELAVPADPGELTLRQIQLLGAAETIVFHPAVVPDVLNRARADAVRIPLDTDDGTERPGLTLIVHPA